MRYIFMMVLGVAMVFSCVSCAKEPAQEPSVSVEFAETAPQEEEMPPLAPDFSLENLDGKVIRLSSFQGKNPVLIMFWATWCVYCRFEIPKLNDLRGMYSPEELAILAVDLQESPGKVADYADRMGMKYEVLLDSDARVATAYGVRAVPTMLLLDRESRAVTVGNRLSDDFLAAVKKTVESGR